MEDVNMGKHAAALAQFESSLRCKPDPYVLSLAFMAACNAQNEAKAKLYYKQLTPPLQQKLAVMCIRNKIDPTDSPACDADALEERGIELTQEGQHAAALEKFEAALACEDNSQRRAEAFTASCNAGSSEKARVHYKKLSALQQKKYAPICIRNKTAYDNTTAAAPAAPACDADDLKDRGMEATNQGDHYAALGWFEKSIACKPDAYVTQLAFMSSCMSQDEAKARFYFKQLSPTQQNKFKVICVRNQVDLDDEPAPAANAKGYVKLLTKPAAKVFVDGQDTGQTTPVSRLPLTPGKHKITFLIGDDRFTYPIIVSAGATQTLSKDLQ
jgi:tetratricopeptide (TPR) repeat protein